MLVRLTTLSLILALALGAQFATFPDRAYFREQWVKAPTSVEIQPAAHLEEFVVAGELELSLRAYIELAMSNNPDINLQRLDVLQQQNNLLAAFSPFDPFLNASFNSTRSTTPTSDVLEGADVRSDLGQTARFTYNQTLDTGTNYSVGYVGSKSASNSQNVTFNPTIRGELEFNVRQPLLRDRGRFVQRIPIMVAESRLRLTEEQVRERVINLLQQAENAYWDAANARESLRVQENSLELARAFLDLQRRHLDVGAISPLDIYQPEQQFATAQVRVTQEQFRLQQAQDVLRRWIGADLDPDFRHMPIVLTEGIAPPSEAPTLDPEEHVARALRLRPELRQGQHALEIDDLNIRGATNELRPDLSINAGYSSQGRGGNFFPDRDFVGSDGQVVVIPGGFPQALDQLFRFRFPTYSFGLTLQLPLRNRRAAADLSNATIQKRRDLYALRSEEQGVRLDVLNAVAGVELAKAALSQAEVARDFSQKRLDAEQRKYDLGVQEAFFVLQAQNDLVDAEAGVLAQSIAYRRTMLTLLRATGELLEARGVVLR
jgi:outer membrane protein TolC